MPASLSDLGGTTLTIALAANESLYKIASDAAGTSYTFLSTQSFTNGGVAATGDFTGIGGTGLTLNASGLARYNTISIVDNGANTSVNFGLGTNGQNTPVPNLFYDNFSVVLDDPSAGIISFNSTNLFKGSSSLYASTTQYIAVNRDTQPYNQPFSSPPYAPTLLSTENGNITLLANQQATPRSGDFYGINVQLATIGTSGTGNITLTGRGGDQNANFGVYLKGSVVRSTAVGSSAGAITLNGTGGGTASTGSGEHGIYIVNNFSTLSSVTAVDGDITLNGQGGSNPAGDNQGV